MEKRNLILSTAIALAFGASVANAGTLTAAVSGGTKFAVENFGSTSSSTTAITPGAITYTVGTSGGIVVNSAGKLYYTLRLAGGTFATAPGVTDFSGTVVTLLTATTGVGTPVLSGDATTIMVPLTNLTASTINVGVGGTIVYTPAANAITGVNGTLNVVAGAVTGTGAMSALGTTSAPNTGTSQAADIDAPAGSGAVAVGVQAITSAVSNLSSFSYNGKIDLTVSPAASAYVSGSFTGNVTFTGTTVTSNPAVATGNVLLGSVTLTNASGGTVATTLGGGTTYFTVAAAATSTNVKIDVTPGAGQAFPIGSQLSMSTVDLCTSKVGTLTAFNTTTAGSKATLTVPTTNITSGTPIFICLSSPSTTNVAAPITPTITVTASNTVIATTTAPNTATGTGYALGYNGSQIDVINYVPAAVGAGWQQYLRVVNTGSVTAAVSASVVDETSGVAGASAIITKLASMAPGAAVTITSQDVEAAVGTLLATTRPRIRITAPTNSLQVQNMLFTPNGGFTNNSNAQTTATPY